MDNPKRECLSAEWVYKHLDLEAFSYYRPFFGLEKEIRSLDQDIDTWDTDNWNDGFNEDLAQTDWNGNR
jgi:hypothetical protein